MLSKSAAITNSQFLLNGIDLEERAVFAFLTVWLLFTKRPLRSDFNSKTVFSLILIYP
jgi:hypothetical protein